MSPVRCVRTIPLASTTEFTPVMGKFFTCEFLLSICFKNFKSLFEGNHNECFLEIRVTGGSNFCIFLFFSFRCAGFFKVSFYELFLY